MKLVLIGMPGAGKSTQGNMLSEQFDIPYLSTGHIFREIAKEKTTLGEYVKKIINEGSLIPDEKTIEIVEEYLHKAEYKKGYILDGFPRTVVQAKHFGNMVDAVIYLGLPDKDALWRLAHRNDALRSDDTVTTIIKRIDIFHKQTKAVIDFYSEKNKLIAVDGTKTVEEVNAEIVKKLGFEIVKNKLQPWKRKRKAIICIAGLPGSGKTEAANYFKAKSLPVVSFGSVINDYITEHKLKQTNEEHERVRMDLRKQYGMEALARLQSETIEKALKTNEVIVIDGLRSFEEYEYLKKQFNNADVIIVALYCDKNIRYARVATRKTRNLLTGAARDLSELTGTNMGPTIAFADYTIANNGSSQEFLTNIENVYDQIYFGTVSA